VVKGYSSASYIFLLGPIGNESLEAAIYDATKNEKGSSLSNVFVDRRVFCVPFCFLPLYMQRDTMVYGTLVKYFDENGKEIPPAPQPKRLGINDVTPPNQPQDITPNLEPLRQIFSTMKQDTPIRLIFIGTDPPLDGTFRRYNFWENYVVVRPINGGWLSGKMIHLKQIKSAEVLKSEQP